MVDQTIKLLCFFVMGLTSNPLNPNGMFAATFLLQRYQHPAIRQAFGRQRQRCLERLSKGPGGATVGGISTSFNGGYLHIIPHQCISVQMVPFTHTH